VSWITDDWRLKLLALGLAVLMLGAVAFAQNPPTRKTLTKEVNYKPATNLVLINPPPSINVTVTGLSDAIANVSADNLTATVDPTHASPGPAVKLNVTVTTTANVSIQAPPPIVVHIDRLQEKDLTVQVVTRPAPGWVVTKTASNPDTVHFTGPVSWEDHLVAFVNYIGQVQGEANTQLNQPIQLQNSNGALREPGHAQRNDHGQRSDRLQQQHRTARGLRADAPAAGRIPGDGGDGQPGHGGCHR